MNLDSRDTSPDTISDRPLWLVIAVVLLAVLAWAGSLFVGTDVESSAGTATPTKTPSLAEVADSSNHPPLSGGALLPTLTPAPTATQLPLETPVANATSEVVDDSAVEPWVVELAQTRGLNPLGRYIVIDQDNQLMHVIDEGRLTKLLEVTTGDPRYDWDTPAWFGVIGEFWGTFRGRGGVTADEGWWLFERGGNFLIHGLPYTLDAAGNKHYKGEDYLGELPASSGCIRLSPDNAQWFSDWQPAGTPIIILPLAND